MKSAIKLVGNELLTLKVLVSSEKMRNFASMTVALYIVASLRFSDCKDTTCYSETVVFIPLFGGDAETLVYLRL